MGVALTFAPLRAVHARGIAGEDDVDAPDLAVPPQQNGEPQQPNDGNGHLKDGTPRGSQKIVPRREYKVGTNASKPMLSPEQSVELRDRLLAELKDLENGEEAALWARRCLTEKNQLATADAQRVEDVFTARLAALTPYILGKRRVQRELLRSP